MALTFQEMIARLQEYWASRGCVVLQPYHTEVGAGTFNPRRSFGAWARGRGGRSTSSRASARRTGATPRTRSAAALLPGAGRAQAGPEDVLDQYFGSLEAIGIDTVEHDVRLVEDDWEGPTLGAWGLGWEVWCDGMEITQFTYFQQVGGLDLDLIPAEITYGLERLAMFMQGVDSVWDVTWVEGVTYADVYRESEREWSAYNYEHAPVDILLRRFAEHEAECATLLDANLPLPAYDQVLKASHTFNLLDARGALSATERAAYVGRVRNLARKVCQEYLAMENGAQPAG